MYLVCNGYPEKIKTYLLEYNSFVIFLKYLFSSVKLRKLIVYKK